MQNQPTIVYIQEVSEMVGFTFVAIHTGAQAERRVDAIDTAGGAYMPSGSEDSLMLFENAAPIGPHFLFQHEQDCCEHVRLEDVCGDLSDLLDTPILAAKMTCDDENPAGGESSTYTFYDLRTIRGSVTLRWLGESNGYYSERVSVYRLDNVRLQA